MDSTSHAGFELSPYDTGARLEPFVYQVQPANMPDPEEADRYGKVDFDNAEARTMFTVWAEPGPGGVVNVWVEKKTDVERVHVHLIDFDPMADAD